MLSTSAAVQAQGQERRGFIGLAFGPSVPIGAFADNSPSNGRAGRAKPGYNNTLLGVAYRFGERVGVAAAVSYGEYMIDAAGEDDWWQVAGLTIGPMYSLPLGSRAAVDVKAMTGIMGTTEVTDSFTTDGRMGGGWMFDLRTTIRYDLWRRWAVFAEAGVISSAQELGDGSHKDVRALISNFGVAFRPGW